MGKWRSNTAPFWTLQMGGWLTYAVVMEAASLPFRQMHEYIGFHNNLLVCEFVASFAVWAICRRLWRREVPLLYALAAAVVLSSLLGVACSTAAMWMSVHWLGTSRQFSWGTVLAAAGGSAFVLIAWSGFYFGLKHHAALEAQRNMLLQSEAHAREAQLRALRYQIQPHFLFNTLNAISSLVLDGQPQLATKMISRLGDLLRRSLESPHVDMTSFRDELAATREYVEIEQVRFGSRLRVSSSFEAEIGSAQVPRYLLQPLVENAIRHGVARRREGGSVSIVARKDAGRLHLVVENETGPAPSDGLETRASIRGLGLTNTQDRLDRIYGGESSFFAGLVEGDSYRVEIVVPFLQATSLPGARPQ